MKMRGCWVGGVLFLISLPGIAATREYSVTGEVVEVGGDRIVVRSGDRTLEFARPRDRSVRGPSAVRPGDQVTIRYRLQAATVEVGRAGQAPGTRGAPPKGSIIRDDRLFYSASTEDSEKPRS